MRDVRDLFAERLKRRLVIGCVSAVIAGLLMCCCLVLLPTVVLPFIDMVGATGNENATIFIWLAIGLPALILVIAAPVLVTGVTIWRRARALDAVFTPLGLTGHNYLLYGRRYEGRFGGREVDVYIYRGPTVEVRLRARTQTRLQVVAKDSITAAVSGAFNQQPLVLNDPELAAFAAYAVDAPWAQGLLDDAQASRAVQALMTVGAGWAIFRRVEVQTGEVVLHLYRSRQAFFSSLELSSAHAWLEALQTLAQSAESLPPPQVPAPPTGITRESRLKMNRIVLVAMAVIAVGMPLCLLAVGVLSYALVSLK